MSIIEYKNVYKAYKNAKKTEIRVVLKDINLTIEENEFVCFIGPSGCGKTTMLNMLAGFEKPMSGEILYKGEKVTAPAPERAVVFQEYSLLPWLDVQKNVEFPLITRTTEEERKQLAEKYLDLVGLSDFKNARPNSLSGGMKQRVAIARTLAMKSEILLMDEPFSALDEHTRRFLDKEVIRIWNTERKTVIFVTHNIEEALLLGTRIILFSSSPGEISCEWRLEPGERDLTSEKMIMLKKEIVEKMDHFINDEEEKGEQI